MENDAKKIEYATQKDLEDQTQVLLAAFDKRFDKLDKYLADSTEGLKRDINNVQALIDGYVKAQESFRQEFEIMKVEFGQMKKIIQEKLGLEIKIT